MPSPAVLFSTAAFFARPIEWTVRLVADCGYEGVEVMVTKDPDTQDPARIRSLAAATGLRVGALHAPCLLLTRKIWGTDPIGKVRRSLEVAADAGVPVVVIHPPYRWQPAFRRWLREELPGIEATTGVDVAVENMFPMRVGRRSLSFHADHALEALDDLGHVVLDTSHAAVGGHDLVDVRRRFGDRLRHVHLSDNAGRGWDSHLPPGHGMLDLDGFLADLATSGYEGGVSLEIDLRQALSHGARLRELMVEMRERTEVALHVARPAEPRAG